MNDFQPGRAASNVSSKVELSVRCRNLIDADFLSKSDPMVVVEQRVGASWLELGRTEVVWDNLNPEFQKKFQVEFHFEIHQVMRFTVYDIDSDRRNLDDHDFLGQVEMSLGEIVSAQGGLTKKLTTREGRPQQGELSVISEELLHSRDMFSFDFELVGLSTGWITRNHFLELRRADENGAFRLVKRTQKRPGKSFSESLAISGQELNNGDNERTLKFELYHYKGNGSHKLLGQFETSTSELVQQGKEFRFNGTKVRMIVQRAKVDQKYSFVDYLQGGMEMNFVVAVDFTASNGDPSQQNSLHFVSNQYPNQYVQAIRAVGDIVEDYDTDKLFPVYGFGARIPPSGQVSHMFPLNFNAANPFVSRVGGIVSAYASAIGQVQLYGPTNFSPVIRETAAMARSSVDQSRNDYFVLLIITDGVITDMEQTKKAIVQNSNLPFSIIIVGVGGADFDAMEELDSDDSLLTCQGVQATRDIVQFVPYRMFLSDNQMESRIKLAKEVLAEVPEQVTSYMHANRIKPNVS